MHIRYYQKNGRVGVKYRLSSDEMDEVMNKNLIKPFPAHDPFLGEIDIGLVPVEIQEAGKEQVREYARQRCSEQHQINMESATKALRDAGNRRRNVNRVIRLHHDGVPLKGRITNHQAGGVFVTLEEPFASEKELYTHN